MSFAGAKHVDVGGKEAVECVFSTSRKGVHGVAHRGVFGISFDTGLEVKRFFDAIDKGPVDAVLREYVDALGGQVYVVVVAVRRVVRCQKFAQKDADIEKDDHASADDASAVFFETPPYKLAL